VVSYNGVVDPPISDNESEIAASPTPLLNVPAGSWGIGSVGTLPGGGALGGLSGMFAGVGSGSVAQMSPWYSFGFLYRAGKLATEDQGTIRVAALNALNTPGSNGDNLSNLLLLHGPQLNRINMRINAMQSYTAMHLLHSGNLPAPTQEFPVYYNATYHIKMHFRSPIPASRNTSSIKPFTLRYEEPPAYNDGTVLY
jgi:hypothetical protein